MRRDDEREVHPIRRTEESAGGTDIGEHTAPNPGFGGALIEDDADCIISSVGRAAARIHGPDESGRIAGRVKSKQNWRKPL